MVYFTGDIHGSFAGIAKFIDKVHPAMDDVVVLLGDVGANYYNCPRNQNQCKGEST